MRVTDMAAAKKHYTQVLGLDPVLEDGGKVYLKAWDEWDHHSLVLEPGGTGVSKIGLKVASADDLDAIEAKSQAFGVTTSRMAKGENPEVSDGLRVILPNTLTMELYHGQTIVGTKVGDLNPQLSPREGTVGIGAPRMDHMLLGADDVAGTRKYFMDVLDFFQTECVVPDLDHQEVALATWLSVGNRGHDIAFIQGPGNDGKLHHLAWQVDGWEDLLRSAQVLAMNDVPIDFGPTQHGITRGKTMLFWDPTGNRDEVFAGGYAAERDRPTMVWTADQLARGIDALHRAVGEGTADVLT